MSSEQVRILVGGLGAIAFLLWFFFGPRKGRQAERKADAQEATIRVEGTYQPDRIVVTAGTPVRLKFDRQEAASCSDRVVIPAFHINTALPAFQTTTVSF